VTTENLEALSTEEVGELSGLPEISYIADSIRRRISYDELTGNLEPAAGECEKFSYEKKEMERIQGLLEGELMKWR
jgi:hypothetical protein